MFKAGSLSFGTPAPILDRPFCITADGAQKLTHFAKCGTTSTRIHELLGPTTHNKYFDPAVGLQLEQYQEDVEASGMSLEADTECTAELVAAPSALVDSKSASKDVKVVVGWVCGHGVSGAILLGDLCGNTLLEVSNQTFDWVWLCHGNNPHRDGRRPLGMAVF